MEVLWVSGQYDPEGSLHSKIIKEHQQNLVQFINESINIVTY